MKKNSGRSGIWPKILIALAVLCLGLLTWYLGMVAAFSGDSGSTPQWIPSVGDGLLTTGPYIAVGGAVLLLLVFIRGWISRSK